MKKLLFPVILAFALAMPAASFADKESKCGDRCGNKGNFGRHGEGKGDLAGKAFGKGHFFLAHAKELGLSKEQTDKIHSIKTDLKKKLVQNEADVKTLKIDLMNALHEDPVDQAKVNALIDKKFEAKKGMAKASVQALFDIKSVLTPEQKEKAKELFREGKGKKKGFFDKKE